MTEGRACNLAAAYLADRGLEHDGFVEARFLRAEKFNQLFGYEKYAEDFWVVAFRRRLKPGVLVEFPPVISVSVSDPSGTAFEEPAP